MLPYYWMYDFALVENQLDSILDAWIVSDLIALIVGWLALKKGLVFSKSQIIQIEWLKSGLKFVYHY